jgi:predicted nucleic acid-binding Zn ribbon protein
VFSRWAEIVGSEIAGHTTPESFADGRLVVRTNSTAWATQLKLLAPSVVRRLNEDLGHGTVTVIEILGPRGPSWKKGPRSVRDGRGPRDTYG